MPDLETLLRDVRPVPDPKWAARLDARVAARFPGRPSRLQRVRMAFRAHFLALGAVGAVTSVFILMIVGLSSMDMSGDEEGSSGAGGAEPASRWCPAPAWASPA
jgi:hypothetical protein